MFIISVVVFLPILAFGLPVKDHSTPYKVARCRANCLDNHANLENGPIDGSKTLYSCSRDRNCFMCWESCELLHQNMMVWGSMCSTPHLCFPGCQTACNYHKEGYPGVLKNVKEHKWIFPSQLIFTKKEQGLKVNWNEPVSRKPVQLGNILYVVLISSHVNDVSGTWQQVTQTTELNFTIPEDQLGDYNEIKIVAATSGGILAEKTTSFTGNHNIVSDDVIHLESSDIDEGAQLDLWKAKVISMVYDDQYRGVDAMITWPALRPYRAAKYEVTWQVKHNSMDVTGHLYTESNVVTLSLWPDANYEIQIRCMSSKGSDVISEVLQLETTDIVKPTLKTITKQCKGCVSFDVFIGFSVGVALVIALILLVSLLRFLATKKRQRTAQEEPQDTSAEPKVTKVKLNGLTGSISEMVSERERKKSLHKSLSNYCGKALANYKLSTKSFALQSPMDEAGIDLIDDGEDDVFSGDHFSQGNYWSSKFSRH